MQQGMTGHVRPDEDDLSAVPAILAFDIGGTRIKAGIVHKRNVSPLTVEPLDEKEGAEGVLSTLVRIGHRLMAEYTATAVGISIKGIVDSRQGTILDVKESLAPCIGTPLAQQLTDAFGLPTVLENDARMYTLGELLYGAGRNAHNLVCLTLGTGVGCGVALERRVLRGPHGISGILGGHITIQADGPRCTCGNIGCLEALVGTSALIREATLALTAGQPSRLCGEALTPYSIFLASATGDPVARGIIQRFAQRLGAGIVSLVHLLDPDLVVLGGGMIGSSEQFLSLVQEYVTMHTWTLPGRQVKVTTAELGDAAALVGVAAFARGLDDIFL